jgi:hypothetical protein
MQVKSIAAPVEARASQPSPSAFFLAGGTEVSSFTRSPGDVEAGASVWVSLSFGREMLAAAVMSPDNDAAWLSAEDLAAMSTDEFRTWVLSVFLHVGSCAATMSAGRSEFRSGFAEDPVRRVHDLAPSSGRRPVRHDTRGQARPRPGQAWPSCSERGVSAGLAPTMGLVGDRPVVACWTGRQVRALRVAARMEVATFAEAVDAGEGAITAWESAPAGEVPIGVQARLDALYESWTSRLWSGSGVSRRMWHPALWLRGTGRAQGRAIGPCMS